MWRIRVLRVLLPLLLLLFIGALALAWRPPESAHSEEATLDTGPINRGTDIRVLRFDGEEESLSARVREYSVDDDGKTILHEVEDFRLSRDDRPPLIIASPYGEIWGEPGVRQMRFDNGVSLHDPEWDLTLTVPTLDVDEGDAKATSADQVELSGSRVSGTARGMVYGLEDQPTELRHVDLIDEEGATLLAGVAFLHDGLDDVELLGDVNVRRDRQELDADRVRMERFDGRTERVVAQGNVRGVALAPTGEDLRYASETADLRWGEAGGLPAEGQLEGRVEVEYGRSEIRCDSLDLIAIDELGAYDATARGEVTARGPFGDQDGVLRSSTLEATLTADGAVLAADAFGDVEFDAQATRGEANRARYDGLSGELHLSGSLTRKARVGRDRIRVAAEAIQTDVRGDALAADRGVEATLLPGGAVAGAANGLFHGTEVIHFVSEELRARDQASRLDFRRSVRGWQGNRSLSAARVAIDDRQRSVVADGNVHSRMPRQDQAATSAGDFIEILAAHLEYAESTGVARYTEEVRLVLDEGWLESAEMDVVLDVEGDSSLSEIRAAGEVELEFRRPADDGGAGERIRGTADRVTFLPGEQTLWLYGETTPARVIEIEGKGGFTEGRVLRYQLDTGALSVESGEAGPARIQSRPPEARPSGPR